MLIGRFVEQNQPKITLSEYYLKIVLSVKSTKSGKLGRCGGGCLHAMNRHVVADPVRVWIGAKC